MGERLPEEELWAGCWDFLAGREKLRHRHSEGELWVGRQGFLAGREWCRHRQRLPCRSAGRGCLRDSCPEAGGAERYREGGRMF